MFLHLCSACALGKSSKKPHKPKSEDTNQEKCYMLHMDLCGLIRVASVNGKKYILVIVDDYSRFTWVKCLRSKDEVPAFIINFLKMIQVRLKETVYRIRTDNGTEFVNQTLREYYEKVSISHETSVARSPQQNGVVKRRNRILIKAARTMLIYAKALLFLWAEAVATACYAQNRSMIRRRYGKTPYEILHDKPPDLSYVYVFGALCYPTNDNENLGKLQSKTDIGIFIGYAPTKKAFRIYNRRTRRIMETIHVDFDELTAMASEHSSSGPALHEMSPETHSSGLVPNPPSSTTFVPPTRSDWDLLFQPMFDESLNPSVNVDIHAPEVIAPIPEAVAPEHAVSTGSSSSTTVDQDAPSPSNSHTTQDIQTPIISHDVEEENHDIEVAHMGNDPYFGIPIPDATHTIVHPDHQVSEHNSKWTKDHPLEKDKLQTTKTSSIPADYVSAGKYLVRADNDRICLLYTFMPEPIQPMPTFTQPAVHTQHTQTNPTGQQYPNNVQSQQFQQMLIIILEDCSARTAQRWGLKDAKRKYNFKARFGGNEESKKMKKTMLKQQFAEFSVTEEEGLHKGYDRFQKILSQSQVALALKTRGGLESMSFDDLYNKLRSLELDVRIGHSYGVKVAAAPTHSAFIGTACSGSKPTYSDQQRIVPSVSQTSGRSDNVMECVLHSFVAENEQDQDMIYEDFDQVDQLEMEEMDLKWQMAMLSLRINRFEKKAGRKMNYNNQQPARFDRRKVRCYKCLQLGHFARECNVKTVDDKARYSAFKVTEVKTDEPKALVSVDSMVNWSDHAAENTTGEVEKVYGMMAGLHADSADASDAAAEFAMMGISPKAYQHAVKTLESQKDWYHKTQIALEEKIRVLSANLENTTNTLSYTEKLHDQAQKEKKEWEVKFVKAGEMHAVPPPITGTYMPSPYQSDIEETQLTSPFRRRDHEPVIQAFKTQTKDIPPSVDIQTLQKSDVKIHYSILEKHSVPCKFKAASVPAGSRNSSASVPADRSDPADSRNRPAVNPADRPHPSRDDGELLLRPQQVTLGGITDHNFGGLRVMLDLVNPHGFTLNDPQGRLKSREALSNLEVAMVEYQEKAPYGLQSLTLKMSTMLKSCSTLTCFLYHKFVIKRTKFSSQTMIVLVLTEEFQLPDASQWYKKFLKQAPTQSTSPDLQPNRSYLLHSKSHPSMNPQMAQKDGSVDFKQSTSLLRKV
ncbi:retrovirus-related pol polyprotein from transposon TNT 1-94 [Tanacetum coccineum]